MKMVKCLTEFDYFFTVFLKNRNLISKIRISNVTDYAALTQIYFINLLHNFGASANTMGLRIQSVCFHEKT